MDVQNHADIDKGSLVTAILIGEHHPGPEMDASLSVEMFMWQVWEQETGLKHTERSLSIIFAPVLSVRVQFVPRNWGERPVLEGTGSHLQSKYHVTLTECVRSLSNLPT
jgi:hypothetical protein